MKEEEENINNFYITKLIQNDEYFVHELSPYNLGKALREVRINRELTIEKLSEMTGVPVSTISLLENNLRQGKIETYMKLFKGLHTKIFFQLELQRDWQRVKSEKKNINTE